MHATHDRDDCAGDCPLVKVTQGGIAIPVVGSADSVGVDRRAFITRAAFSAAALALAACSASDATSPFSGSYTLTVADYPTLATVGGVALVSANGASLAVVRTGSSSFLALSRVCPHEGGRIDPSGSGFLCQKHGARFSADGTWTGGERTSSMRAYSTAYDSAAGTLTIG